MPQFVYKHPYITMILVVWMLALFTVVTLKVFFDPADIPTGTVAAYGTVFALAGLALGLWKWRNRGGDE